MVEQVKVEKSFELGRGDGDAMVREAEACAREAGQVTTSQMRNLYAGVIKAKEIYDRTAKGKALKADDPQMKKAIDESIFELELLRAKFAYMIGREEPRKKEYLESFSRRYENYMKPLRARRDVKTLDEMFRLMEAIVCYHRWISKGG
jgi:CRISPR type III-A-associated protein Csm2